MAYNISYIYQVIDKFSPALKKIRLSTDKLKEKMEKTGTSLKGFGEKAGKLQNALAGVATGAAMAFTTGKAMEFEDVMTDVAKVVNFAGKEQFGKFREYILKTSTELGKMPKDLAQIAVAGGKLGVLPKDMNNFIGVVARTSVAFDMLEETAGNQIGSIQAKLGLTVNETGNLMDAVNFLADNTSAGGSRMIEIIARTSGTLKSIGMPRKFMAGWAAFADQMEVTPELAASGLNMMINKLQRMPGMTEKLIANPQKAITSVFQSLAKLDKVKRIKAIDQMFGPEAGRFVKKAVVNMKKFDDTMKLIGDDSKFAGSMMKELQAKLATGKTAWSKIKATLDVIAITIGDVMLPYIKEIAPKIVRIGFAFRNWAKQHPQLVKIGLAIAGILAVVSPLIVGIGILISSITAIGGIIGVTTGVFLLAFASWGVAIYEVWKNWDYLMQDIKAGLKWWMDTFTFEPIVQGIENAVNKIKPMVEWFYNLDEFLGFGSNPNKNEKRLSDQELEEKIARVRAMRRQRTGIAAENTINSKSTLNGSITVAPAKGAEVQSATLSADVPGNLGLNIAGGG